MVLIARTVLKKTMLGFAMIIFLSCSAMSLADDALKNFDYTYHYKLIDKEGEIIILSQKSFVTTQRFYMSNLIKASDEKVQKEMESIQKFIEESKISERERAHIRHAAITILAKRGKTAEGEKIYKKAAAMSGLINATFFDKELSVKTKHAPVSELTITNMQRVSGQNGLSVIFEIIIQALIDWLNAIASNSDYENQCLAAGVPIPPDWGDWSNNGWQNLGELTDEFISRNRIAEVVVHNSSAPEGTCVALPRTIASTGIMELLGVICLGVESENACFWDGSGMPFHSDFRIQDQLTSASDFTVDWRGGVCTDCHAGENPFVARRAPSILGFSGSSTTTDWYTPIGVPSMWPQNPGPTNLLNNISTEYNGFFGTSYPGNSCIDCHKFPDVSDPGLAGYCQVVLKLSARRTMPSESDPSGWSWPNNSEYRNHIQALRNACP